MQTTNKFISFLFVLLLVFYVIHCVPIFIDTYQSHVVLTKNEIWREKECNDPVFFNKMKVLQSDFCELRRNEATLQSPLLVALQECLPCKSIIKYIYVHLMYIITQKKNSEFLHDDDSKESWHYTFVLFSLLVMIYIFYNHVFPWYNYYKAQADHLSFLEECSPLLTHHHNHAPSSINETKNGFLNFFLPSFNTTQHQHKVRFRPTWKHCGKLDHHLKQKKSTHEQTD